VKRPLCLALLLLFAACAGRPDPLAAASCPTETVPVATAWIDPGEVVRNDIGMEAMRQEAERVVAAAASADLAIRNRVLRHYFGQSLTRTRLDARLVAVEIPLAAGGSCAVPHRLDLVLRFVRREIRVATETHADACLRREVEAHELRHVALDDAMIDEFRPLLVADAHRLAHALRPVPGASYAEAKARLSARLRAETGLLYEAFEATRHHRHQAEIDTPQEYARVRLVCGDRDRWLAAQPS
jgi:hypothetical protein